jgi:2-C-methyl-D-erythritol 2,4-cyclodiphosphate synthase
MRVGVGYDVHPLVPGRKLVLGGVEIPFEKGLDGHSDADALVHAIIDALLGAAGLGDIGMHFPSSDPALQGVSSLILLGRVRALLQQARWRVGNVDATIIAEQPVLAPYVARMRESISRILEIEMEQVAVKSTTAKGLGFIGHGEAIAVHAVALLEANETGSG